MGVTPREQHIQTVCLLILSAVAIGLALWWLRAVMIPFVLATFLAFGLSPLINFQRRLRMPRPLAVLVTLLLGCMVLSLLGGMISIQLAENIEVYQQQINQLLDRSAALLQDDSMMEGLRTRFGFDPLAMFNSVSAGFIKTISRMLAGTTKAIVELLSQGLLVVVFLFFLLLGDTARSQPNSGVLGEVEVCMKRYIVTKVLLSAVTGALVGSTLALLGVDLALVFGLFAFLLNFIPSIGPLIATLLPLPVVLVNQDSTLTIVLAIAVPGVIQFLIGNAIEPRIMGGSMDLHPVTILLALIVWGMLWGVVGMLLATPLTAVMKILFERIEQTTLIAELLAGRLDRLQSD